MLMMMLMTMFMMMILMLMMLMTMLIMMLMMMIDDDVVMVIVIISRPRLHKGQQSATRPATAQDASSTDFGLPRKPQNATILPHDEFETLQDAPKTPQDD